MKVWIVTFDGLYMAYSTSSYLQGIYTSKEMADRQAESLASHFKNRGLMPYIAVYETILDKPLPVSSDGEGSNWPEYSTDICFALYAE